MEKIFLIPSLTILLLSSCDGEYIYNTKSRVYKFSHLEENNNKRLYKKKIPPTELLQVGLNKRNKFSLESNSVDQEFTDQEIADSYIADDGTYVGKYKIGNQYTVFGKTYQPQEYDNFEEVGISSWYGDDFHGKLTANGEIYHKGDITAAHRTLPLPSIVMVTNLDNGKTLKVRINDRGPFAKNRIIDMSERAAKELGFANKGTANVKLKFLKQDTEEMLQKLGIDH
jgi:hypothetical protein